jgi:hypothetical protein
MLSSLPMKKSIFILSLAFSISAFAQLVSLKPFEFKDPSQGQRPELKKEYSRQLYKFNLADAQTLVKDEDTEARLLLFPETLKLMRHARAMENGGGAVSVAPQFCGKHNAPSMAPSVSPTCASLDVAMQAVFANKQKVCRDIETPEAYMSELPPYSGYDEKRFTANGLMSLIETAGQQLLGHKWPAGMISQEMADRGRTILLRLRYTTLIKKVTEQQARYQAVLTQLAANPNCVPNANNVRANIQALATELAGAGSYLERVYQAGLKQALADQAKVVANKRMRDSLPFPALTDADREWLSFYVAGVYWRIRGGGIFPNIGTQTRRSVFAKFVFEKLADLNCGLKCDSSVKDIGGKMRLKLQLKGWGEWADMGTWQGEGAKDRFNDMTFMTWRGEYQVDSSVKALESAKYNSAPFFLSGLQMGSTYWYPTVTGMKVPIYGPPTFSGAEALSNGPWPLGEIFQGATMGLGFARSLLQGRTK